MLPAAACVAFTSNRDFPTTAVHPVFVLIRYPREIPEIPGINYVVPDCCVTKNTNNRN